VSQLALKGQETVVTIMRSGNLEDQLTEVDSFGATFKFEKLQRRNLGETTIRTDEIFGGVEGKIKLRVFTESFLLYLQALENRARRVSPTIIFNFTTTLLFPGSTGGGAIGPQSPTITFPDASFGDFPLDASSAKDYVTIELDWQCGEFSIDNL
jgi:hypothetical protein